MYVVCDDDGRLRVFCTSAEPGAVEIDDEEYRSISSGLNGTNAVFIENSRLVLRAVDLQPEAEVHILKMKLAETDYKAIKYAEGLITEEEFAPIRAQRQAWRDRINELENGS